MKLQQVKEGEKPSIDPTGIPGNSKEFDSAFDEKNFPNGKADVALTNTSNDKTNVSNGDVDTTTPSDDNLNMEIAEPLEQEKQVEEDVTSILGFDEALTTKIHEFIAENANTIISGIDLKNFNSAPDTFKKYLKDELEKVGELSTIQLDLADSKWSDLIDCAESISPYSVNHIEVTTEIVEMAIAEAIKTDGELIISGTDLSKSPIDDQLMNLIKNEMSRGHSLKSIQQSLGSDSKWVHVVQILEKHREDLRLSLDKKTIQEVIREFLDDKTNTDTKIAGHDLATSISYELVRFLEKHVMGSEKPVEKLKELQAKLIDENMNDILQSDRAALLDSEKIQLDIVEKKKKENEKPMTPRQISALEGVFNMALGLVPNMVNATANKIDNYRKESAQKAFGELNHNASRVQDSIDNLNTAFQSERDAYLNLLRAAPGSADQLAEAFNKNIQDGPKKDMYNDMLSEIEARRKDFEVSAEYAAKRGQAANMPSEKFEKQLENKFNKWLEETQLFKNNEGKSLFDGFDDFMKSIMQVFEKLSARIFGPKTPNGPTLTN